MTSSNSLEFFVNGELIRDSSVPIQTKLANYLRKKLLLTGTKVACGVGGCGSCTVILSRFHPIDSAFSHTTVNACITPVLSVHGAHILSIEGIGDSTNGTCTYLQDAIARGHGTQCGFCTPGMVMSMQRLFQSNPVPDIGQIKSSLNGNLCRCTGYRPILDSFQKCSEYNACQASKGNADIEDFIGCRAALEEPRHVSQTPRIQFPVIEALLRGFHTELDKAVIRRPVGSAWQAPTSLEEMKGVLKETKNVRLVGGNTDLFGAEMLQGNLVSVCGVAELRVVEETHDGILLGAALTISEMIFHLEKLIEAKPEDETRIFVEVVKLMSQFGSEQIRNAATVGGSLSTTKLASDVQTFLHGFACKTIVEHFDSIGEDGIIQIPLLLKLWIPFSNEFQSAWAYKVMRRAANDASVLSMAILIEQPSTSDPETVSLSIGGTAVLEARVPTRTLPDDFRLFILENIVARDPKETEYIETLAQNIWSKFAEWFSGKTGFERTENWFKSTQLFQLTPEGPNVSDLVGKSVPHASAHKHGTGEAEFLDDISKDEKELAMALILSQRAHARIVTIDTSESRAVEGVVGFVFAEDLKSPDHNWFGVAVQDEEIFASKEVQCIGQTIGGVVAKDLESAREAAALVKVQYEDLPSILTIEDAIQNESYYSDFGIRMESGTCSSVLESCDHVLSGSLEIGGQAHFYMETQGCLGIPKKDGELELIASTQYPAEVQHQVAARLDIPANRVVVKVRRIGGGFGGKETRCLLVALPVAVAAQKFRCPVRCVLDRKTDMLLSGKRHPVQAFYTVGFDTFGRVQALSLKVYINGGMSLDVSHAAIERILLNIDNAYNIPHMNLTGYICKTNLTSNTVFRGTGGPQAAIFTESLMDQVAAYLGSDPIQVRKLNMYMELDSTHYGQILYKSTIRQCWDECLRMSGYYERKAAADAYNKLHPYKKRGISVNPAHFGVAFTVLFLNQASALVHIYKDGSVLLNHGGVEIGQGIHSKMIQIATRELGIPGSKIRIVETSTDKVPNAAPNSASVSSDLNGMAILSACRKLAKRLEPYRLDLSCRTWEDVVTKAFMDRVCLSATGFYKTPGIGWTDETTRRGSPFNYFSTGAACTEVELDCLTGHHQLLRTDIVMDVGQSLNPAIDVGQIEGAFMQGVGLCTLEQLSFNELGGLETRSISDYKLPTVSDTPLEFNVSFLTGASNPRAIYSSKTVGEPPLLLSTSVLLAIKDAVRSFRREKGLDVNFTFHSPATLKKILLACHHPTH